MVVVKKDIIRAVKELDTPTKGLAAWAIHLFRGFALGYGRVDCLAEGSEFDYTGVMFIISCRQGASGRTQSPSLGGV